MKNQNWLVGPITWVSLLAALLAVWALLEPATLVRLFDQDGYSPFELLTIPVFAAAVPLVWWKCPFAGSRRRRVTLSLMVTLVSFMAIAKELDWHLAALHALYPDFVSDAGGLLPGLFKPNGAPLTGTPFKMRVLTCAAVPSGMKVAILAYFAAFFGVFAAGFVYLLPTWLRGVFKLDAAAWSWVCFGASGVVVQVSDRLPAWLGHAGQLGQKRGEVVTCWTSLCTCLEEGGEMMIAVFALMTICLSWRTLHSASSAADL